MSGEATPTPNRIDAAGAGTFPSASVTSRLALDEPGSTGDIHYDTLLASGLAYALTRRGLRPRPWMDTVPALTHE